MATYTKETALYDTGAIANDIGEAAGQVRKYITSVGDSGIKVHPYNNTTGSADQNNYTKIDGEGLEVFKDSNSIAKFGGTTRIGMERDASITITSNSISGYGTDRKTFFNFNEVAGVTIVGVTDDIVPERSISSFPQTASDGLSSTLSNTPVSTNVIFRFSYIPLPNPSGPSEGGVSISITFNTGTAETKIRTFTASGKTITVGVTYDGNKTFSGIYASSSSLNGTAYAECSYSITGASAPTYELGGSVSANGAYSFAEGFNTVANGVYSHAAGEGTIAENGQFVVGSYNENVLPGSNNYPIFIVGGGSADEDRVNLFSVDLKGYANVENGYKVNGSSLNPSHLGEDDYVIDAGTSGSWTYRKWNSGKVEAWCGYSFASAASTVWASPIRYWDKTINIPSEIFSVAPRLMVSAQSNQYWVGGASASSATAGTVRVLTVATSSMAVNLSIYAVSG